MVIFMDTSALFALVNTQDGFHEIAKRQWQNVLENDDTLVCTNYVIVESISLIQRRLGMDFISALQIKILSLIETEWMDETQHETALDVFLAANRRQLSLVDCSSFETMRRLKIETVFTFDEHFREQGFTVIP